MSLISIELTKDNQGKITDLASQYLPDDKSRDRIQFVRNCFVQGNMNMYTPRREFNDLSLVERMSVDRMSWNTYQPNDGNAYDGDPINSWKSNAIKPIVRNKAISIAAHATAALIFPKVFAEREDSDEDKEAASVMRDLMEWTAHQSKYPRTFLHSVINALVDPASLVFTEYCEVMRKVKMPQEDGTYKEQEILDTEYSGFQDSMIGANELYIEDFYESNIQKQGFLIMRKIITFGAAKSKYENYSDNFKYVKAGMQTVYSDANNTFYYVYDPNITGDLVEELTFWNRNLDLKLIMVNGVLMCDPDEPNPRLDKQYPFAKTGYELIDGGKCFYYKSLVFKMGPDARIVNDLYPMIVDGTYLSIFPPMMARGGEDIGGDVIVPGAVTTLSSPDADLKPINSANNLAAGMNTMMDVIRSLDQSSADPQTEGMSTPGTKTAYETSILNKNAMTDLTLFLRMIGMLVEDFGNLRKGDIIQHLTVADVSEIAGKDILKYKSFLIPSSRGQSGNTKSKNISFDINLPDGQINEAEEMKISLELLKMQGGPDGNKEIWKVNPELFRQLKYKIVVSPDIMNPLSDEITHALNLEAYDRLITNPIADQEKVTKDFLLGIYDVSRDDPEKYIRKMQPQEVGQGGYAPGQQGSSPSASNIMNKVAQSGGAGAPVPTRMGGR